jgi:zona occludens toxin (predicted ATPase)
MIAVLLFIVLLFGMFGFFAYVAYRDPAGIFKPKPRPDQTPPADDADNIG